MKTVIKAVFPREARFAKVRVRGFDGIEHPDDPGLHESMAAQFGEPFRGMSYIGPAHLNFAPLPASQLLELLIYETVQLSVLAGFEDIEPGVMVWLMPWGASHVATVETCGVNRQDLLALSERFLEKHQQQPPAELAETRPRASDWTLTKPERIHGYTEPLYQLLREAHSRGAPKPTAYEVIEAWEVNRPNQIAKVFPGEGLDYYTLDSTKHANLKAIRSAIDRMTGGDSR